MESGYGRQEDHPETYFGVWRVTNVLNEIDEHRKCVSNEDIEDINGLQEAPPAKA